MTKDEFMALAAARYDDLQRLNVEEKTFYTYEEKFAGIWTDLGRAVLEANLGDIPVLPRKKRVAKVVLAGLS